jgi:hypothetical protein
MNIFRGDLEDRLRVAVIGEIGDDDARAAGYRARNSERQFVSLAACATEHDVVEFVRKLCG